MSIDYQNNSGRRSTKWFRSLGFVVVGGALFAYGLGVGHYKWPPFGLIQQAMTVFAGWLPVSLTQMKYRGEQELLQSVFTDPVSETELYYSPILSLEGIRKANQHIFMPRKGFEIAYEEIHVLDVKKIEMPANAASVVKISFYYQGLEFEAFAYGNLPSSCSGQGTASLIIPGSGLNQSQGIATNDPGNYHYGILSALKGGGGGITPS